MMVGKNNKISFYGEMLYTIKIVDQKTYKFNRDGIFMMSLICVSN